MEIKIGKKYRFLIKTAKVLSFTGIVLSISGNFITFKDKFGKILNYNLESIISYEEISQ